jgi:antitoxin ParD1/3/4
MASEVNVLLPAELAELIERKVRSGAYASAADVVRDGVETLLERDAARERWLLDEVPAGHREFLANPDSAIPASRVLERVRAKRRASDA